MTQIPAVWWPKPEAGDIVWCHFPHLPNLDPGPKPRPALVVRVREHESLPRAYRAFVAYGTSQKTTTLHKGEFLLQKDQTSAFQLSGLSFDTKFDFNRTVELPYSSEYFKPPPSASASYLPHLGLLHASMMRKAQAAWRAAKP